MTHPALPTRAVLAATDLTGTSDAVLRAAAALARPRGAQVHVVHAVDFPPSPYLDQGVYFESFGAEVAQAEAALRAQVERTVPDVPVAEPRVEFSAPHRAIADTARQVAAELVVVGPHGHRDLDLGLRGGTTDRLMPGLHAPCLVARGELRMPLSRVVVPIDPAEWTSEALELALAWAAELGAGEVSVVVVHVAPPAASGKGLDRGRAEMPAGWNPKVDQAVAASGHPEIPVREMVVWGDDPARTLSDFAETEDADLIVMATHGRGAIGRVLLGSTAQAVARTAPCPMLLVPPHLWRHPHDQPVDAKLAATP